MLTSTCCVLAVVLVVGAGDNARANEPVKPPLLQINLRLLEGDPLGSREAGTLKVLAEPKIVTLSGRAAEFICGLDSSAPVNGWQESGFTFGIKPERCADGSIDVKVDMTRRLVVERNGGDVRRQCDYSQYERNARLGDMVRLQAGRIRGRQTWVEFP